VSVSGAASALAILNPEAGHGKGRKLATTLAKVFRDAGMRIEVLVTPAPAEAARLAAGAAEPKADIRGNADYKRDVARVFVQRGLHTAVARAQGAAA